MAHVAHFAAVVALDALLPRPVLSLILLRALLSLLRMTLRVLLVVLALIVAVYRWNLRRKSLTE